MKVQNIAVHCTCSEDGQDIAEIIRESFRLFLRKELPASSMQSKTQRRGSEEWP